MVDIFSVNPGSWLVNGNIVTDELDNIEDYILTNSLLELIEASTEGANPTVGNSLIQVVTPGEDSGEGVMEWPVTVDVDSGDSVWHSLYIRGSGSVVLQSIERDNTGDIINTVESTPLVLSSTDQELHLNTLITTGVLISFKVVTSIVHAGNFYINGAYVNKGETPRTGQNLAADNVISCGGNGTIEGFVAQNIPDGSISVLPISNKLEMSSNYVS